MKILDMCCGGRMFWWNKDNPMCVFIDKRKFEGKACDGRTIKISPDIVMDFRKLHFKNETFDLIVFDPPHLVKLGDSSRLAQKYGKLNKETWSEDLKKGFNEGMRVLKKNGVLIFKRNEFDIKIQDIIKIFGVNPLFGNRTSKNTIRCVFNKIK